jgi:uncharacterized membrane protein
MSVKKSRSLVKSLTWRVVAMVSGFVTLYALSEDVSLATIATLITNGVNFVAYYYHERIWNAVRWGKELQ